jgi:hypothetical protein
MVDIVTAHLDQAICEHAMESHMAIRCFSATLLLHASPHPRDNGHPNSPQFSDVFVLRPPEVDLIHVDQPEKVHVQPTATQFDDDRLGHNLFLGAGSKTRPGTPIQSRVLLRQNHVKRESLLLRWE